MVIAAEGNENNANPETASLMLSADPGYTVGAPSTATITILSNVVVTLPDVSVVATTPNASRVGLVSGLFTFMRTGSTSAALTVNYSLGGTATDGTDYSLLGTSSQFRQAPPPAHSPSFRRPARTSSARKPSSWHCPPTHPTPSVCPTRPPFRLLATVCHAPSPPRRAATLGSVEQRGGQSLSRRRQKPPDRPHLDERERPDHRHKHHHILYRH